jgi:DNA-binding protein YbaB
MRIRNIEIEEQVYSDNDKEMLEDLIMAAINNALDNAKRKAEEITKNQTNDLLGGMNLNGFPFQK